VSGNRVIKLFQCSKGSLYYKPSGYPVLRKSFRRSCPVTDKVIKAICKVKSTYGVPRVRALAHRDHGMTLSSYMVHRIMKENELLIKREGRNRSRSHSGKVAVTESNVRWSSDITSIKFWGGEKLRFTYILDCCDREVLAYRLQKHILGSDIELMLQEALLKRFGGFLPDGQGVEFLHDNGPEYIEHQLQEQLRKWQVTDCHTPTYSPQSNGISEAFNGTFKRDYVYEYPLENVEEVKKLFPKWIEEYNTFAPHSALNMKTPHEFFNLNRAA